MKGFVIGQCLQIELKKKITPSLLFFHDIGIITLAILKRKKSRVGVHWFGFNIPPKQLESWQS